MNQPKPLIEPLDAWRRTLDVVIASAPTGYGAQVIRELQDALRYYQQHGPIQRVTQGELKTCNQLTYLAAGQLMLCAPKPAVDALGFTRESRVIGFEQRFDDGGYVHTPTGERARLASALQRLQPDQAPLATSQPTAIHPVEPRLGHLDDQLVARAPSQPARPAATKPVPRPVSAPQPASIVPHPSD